MKIGISACLLGKNVRYDGSNKKNDKLLELLKGHELIEICPEFLANFSVPHLPLEIKDNKVYTSDLEDVTDKLLNGSKVAYELIQDCDFLILKSKSPSCGYKKIYDGSFSGLLIDGNGIFTNIALANNKKVFSDEDFDSITTYLKENDCNL